MLKNIFFTFGLLLGLTAYAQNEAVKYTISGSIKDAVTGEGLIGASVMAKPGVGGVTDVEGNYSFKIEPGTYILKVNYVGYAAQQGKIKVTDKDIVSNFIMESQTLDEVEVVANIGTIRETPVAITNISSQKIQEELAGRDLPMILNSTPGVYATQQGGGAGDSRISLRGFDQTNIAVMVDGVPVNDMENGSVYWSNWDGLSEITKTMQVQRGLGASKLAVSSAGGLMNIITNTLDQKKQLTVKQELGNNNYRRTALSYNSELIKNKFGVVMAGSRRQGDGYVQGTYIDAWSYFIKLSWKVNERNLLTLSANGAPQSHGQRTTKTTIAVFNKEYAAKVGVTSIDSNITNSGLMKPDSPEKDRTYNYEVAKLHGKDYNLKNNYYNKPLINLSHFWTASDKFTISTVAYASYGFGGGTSLNSSPPYDVSGYINLDSYYETNSKYLSEYDLTLAKRYGDIKKSTTILQTAVNNHRWYGILSTGIYKLSKPFTLTFGIDARYYNGIHYRKIEDLLGGDYYVDNSDATAAKGYYDYFSQQRVGYSNELKQRGDKIGYYYNGQVNWGGLFSQLEYKKDKWTAFVTLSGSYTGYQRIDNFSKMDVTIGKMNTGWDKFTNFFKGNKDDKVLNAVIGYNDVLLANSKSNNADASSYIVYNVANANTYQHGDTTYVVTYTLDPTTLQAIPATTTSIVDAKSYTADSKEAKASRTTKKWFPGYTVKGGVNYNINANFNVYANIGVLSIAPKFNNVYNGNAVGNKEYEDARNQLISSQELGFGAKFKKFAGNVNIYYTLWNNKPQNTQTINNVVYNVNGVNTKQIGIELDWVYKFIKQLEWDAAISIADWRYANGTTVYYIDPFTGQQVGSKEFDATNVHLGDAAQLQISNGLKWHITKRLYIKPRYVYFGKNYANFMASDLSGVYSRRESWKMPNYGLLDIGAGYEFKLDAFKINLFANVTNVLNTFYISDAQNNGLTTGTTLRFDANSATVFVGPGRQCNFGAKLTF